MVWFNTKELEKNLADGNVSDKEVFNYLVADFILSVIFTYDQSTHYNNEWIMVIDVIFMILVTYFALKKTFDINKNGDNKDYFKRYVALSLINGIRLIAFAFIAAIPIGIFLAITGCGSLKSQPLNDFTKFALSNLLMIIYYVMLVSSFKRLNKHAAIAPVKEIIY